MNLLNAMDNHIKRVTEKKGEMGSQFMELSFKEC